MASQHQSRKDSMDDNTEEKLYSDSQSDADASSPLNTNNNNFMNQVHKRRKNSLSFTGDQQSDSPLVIDDDMDDINEYKYDTTTPRVRVDIPHLISTSHSAYNQINFMKRQSTQEHLFDIHNTKLRRRHSADKILCKPSMKNINSVDYLNRMVITLRSKIATYKEDLRIAAELGQNLFSQNSRKDLLIHQHEQDIYKLKSLNDELSNIKNQLVQTTKLDAEHARRLATDLSRQKSNHQLYQSKYKEECILLREQLEHSTSDIKHLEQLTERQRLEIESLDTRNEAISTNAGETIDDLSRELAEEKDGHSNLKHKYQKLHSNFTKSKINFEKRGTEIKNLKKELQEKELKLLSFGSSSGNGYNNGNSSKMSINKQEIKLLYRQMDNYKDEILGMQKHVDSTKSFLKTTINYLENTSLLMKDVDIDQIYTLCKNARQFLGINKPPPDPVYERSPEPPPELPKERSIEPLPNDDISSPSLPREPTPPLKVSQRETRPLAVPAPPKSPTPPPQHPPSLPPQPITPQQPKQKPIKPVKVRNKPSLPPSLPPSAPTDPKPSNPLPPPKSQPIKKSKIYSTPALPQIRENPKLPPPTIPNHPPQSIPTPINEVTPKPKRFSSAISPIPKAPITAPQIPNMPTQPPMMPTMPQIQTKSKINANALIPTVIKQKQPQMPPTLPNHRNFNSKLPLPKSQPIKKSKIYSTPSLPQVREHPKGPPTIPNHPPQSVPTPIPNEVIITPKPKRFSSAITPKTVKIKQKRSPKAPTTAPQMPNMPMQPPMMPTMPQIETKSKIKANAMIPKVIKQSQMAAPPRMPNDRNMNNKLPAVVEREIIPKGKIHNLGVMPGQIVDEKPLYIPSMPKPLNKYNKVPNLPYNHKQEIKKEVRVLNKVMAPPRLPPSVPSEPVDDKFVPSPKIEEKVRMEDVKGKTHENNKRKKKKRKSKKPKKDRDSMEAQKQHLVIFFSTYSDSKNWGEGGKDHGVQKYILKFAEREPLNARMAFLYSMTLYLGQIVGVNKRCISHAFMLFKSVRAQIDTLCEEFALILQTLEHHNDDKLWKYVYSFLYNAAAYFKHIQRFVGTRTSVDNPRKYQQTIKSQSRDYTRTSITFRKMSGLSDLSEYNNDNTSNISGRNSDIIVQDKKHQVYGNNGDKKSNKKKKKSSYA